MATWEATVGPKPPVTSYKSLSYRDFMEYAPAIGLEIHVELATATKCFCGCKNRPHGATHNTFVCPICLGHPGALPVVNKEAVKQVVRVGYALDGAVQAQSHFDRKSYFYPDLPKGYQISQYEAPLILGGELNGVRIRRIHLEEDTARLLHGGAGAERYSAVDFNRAGVPLMELVTEPDITSADEAAAFAQELQLILRYLGAARADMEKGEMRIEANVSEGADGKMGTKVEVKNLNSFKAVREAIEFELDRQKKVLQAGEPVIRETRGWDDDARVTRAQRSKEEAHDYRYMPEPDLPPLDFEAEGSLDLAALRAELPELPRARRDRLTAERGLSRKQSMILAADPAAADFFEAATSELDLILDSGKGPSRAERDFSRYQTVYNYLTSDLFGIAAQTDTVLAELKITPERFADLIALVLQAKVTSRMAKDILFEMASMGEDAHAVIKRKGLEQVSDESVIEEAVKAAVFENAKAVADYRRGKKEALQFLLGKVMRQLGGQGSPEKIRAALEQELRIRN